MSISPIYKCAIPGHDHLLTDPITNHNCSGTQHYFNFSCLKEYVNETKESIAYKEHCAQVLKDIGDNISDYGSYIPIPGSESISNLAGGALSWIGKGGEYIAKGNGNPKEISLHAIASLANKTIDKNLPRTIEVKIPVKIPKLGALDFEIKSTNEVKVSVPLKCPKCTERLSSPKKENFLKHPEIAEQAKKCQEDFDTNTKLLKAKDQDIKDRNQDIKDRDIEKKRLEINNKSLLLANNHVTKDRDHYRNMSSHLESKNTSLTYEKSSLKDCVTVLEKKLQTRDDRQNKLKQLKKYQSETDGRIQQPTTDFQYGYMDRLRYAVGKTTYPEAKLTFSDNGVDKDVGSFQFVFAKVQNKSEITVSNSQERRVKGDLADMKKMSSFSLSPRSETSSNKDRALNKYESHLEKANGVYQKAKDSLEGQLINADLFNKTYETVKTFKSRVSRLEDFEKVEKFIQKSSKPKKTETHNQTSEKKSSFFGSLFGFNK